jgi:universal stress protein A
MNKILVPMDGSEESCEALRLFLKFNDKEKSKIYLMNVQKVKIPHEEYFTLGDRRGLVKYHKEKANEILDKGVALLDGIEFEKVIRMGDPVTEILDFSDKIKADLIIMGSHGRTGLSAVMMGSVSTKVLTYSKRPVMITRPKQEEPEEFKKKYLGFKID